MGRSEHAVLPNSPHGEKPLWHNNRLPLAHGTIPPRTAQAAMRHSSLDLTINVYTDPTLLHVAGAAKLP